MDNKKILGISVVAVLVLVVAIVATSYAAFTADLTGTKENVLRTGYVELNCAETTFNVSDTQPMSDAEGIAASNNAAICNLTSTMKGEMTVGYDIQLTEVDAGTTGDGLDEGDVKIQATRVIDNGTPTYLAGTSASEGVTIGSISGNTGDYGATGYVIDSNKVTGDHAVLYTIKTWVTSTSNNDVTTEEPVDGVCSDPTHTSQSACEGAGEIWGTKQTQSQAGGTFSYKLKIGATQTTE